jgi:hypothetical protein
MLFRCAEDAEILTSAWTGMTWGELPNHVKIACNHAANNLNHNTQ